MTAQGERMLSPEEVKRLTNRLSLNADRIIEKLESKTMAPATSKRGRPGAFVVNTLQQCFQDCMNIGEGDAMDNGWPLWIDDVLSGVTRLDWYRQGERSIPLSNYNMRRILQSLPIITTRHIAGLLQIQERQAQRYMKAITLCYPFLERGWGDSSVRNMHYPLERPVLGHPVLGLPSGELPSQYNTCSD